MSLILNLIPFLPFKLFYLMVSTFVWWFWLLYLMAAQSSPNSLMSISLFPSLSAFKLQSFLFSTNGNVDLIQSPMVTTIMILWWQDISKQYWQQTWSQNVTILTLCMRASASPALMLPPTFTIIIIIIIINRYNSDNGHHHHRPHWRHHLPC